MAHIDVLQVELNKEEISQMKHHLDSKNRIFSDKRYLESLGPPISIVGRKKLAEKILEFLYVPKNGIAAPFVSVYGKSGTGKSTVTKYVCENLSDLASSVFVNLRKTKTNFGCANLILEELDCSAVKPHEGINHAIDKIESKIFDTLLLEKKHNFVLILDEFDIVFSDVRSRPSDFVYKLLDMVERLLMRGCNLCIVAISNSSMSDYSLDDRVKSRMGNYEVFFPPYTESKILQIIQDRAKKAFVKKPSNKVLEKCANLSSEESGDCRRALQLLRLAGELANGDVVQLDDVINAYEKSDSDKLDMILESVTAHQKFLLASFAQASLFLQKEYYTTREIYERYQGLCGDSTKRPLSSRRVFDLLADLENTGIISSKTRSSGRHGYHNFYKLTYDYRLVGWIINKDWWNAQMEEKEKDEFWEKITKESQNPKKTEETKRRMHIARGKYIKRFYEN